MSKIYVDEILPKDNATVDGSKLSALPSSAMPTGSVIQVQSTSTNTTTVIGTANTWTAPTDLNVSITPKFATSKILIVANVDYDANAAGRMQWFTLYRDSTNLGEATNGFSANTSSGGRLQGEAGMNYLDSPNTTSSITYSVYTKCNSTSTYVNLYGSYSTITVMEIAG